MTPAKTPLVTILAGAALAAAQPATAQTTIFSDSFDRETGLLEIPAFGGVSDWGQTDNAAGGIASPTGYLTTTSQTNTLQQTVGQEVEGKGEVRFGRLILDLNLAAIPEIASAGGFAVEFDVNPADSVQGQGRDWAGVLLSDTNDTAIIGTQLAVASRNNESVRFGVAPRNSGTMLARINGQDLDPDTPDGNADVLIGDGNPFDGGIGEPVFDAETFARYQDEFDPNDPADFISELEYRVRVEVTSSFETGAVSVGRVFIDGEQVDLNLATPEPDNAEFLWGQGGQAYLAFFGNTALHTFDNLLVETFGSGGGLIGDLNGDGFVGAGDLDILLGVWNQSDTGAADLNADGFIGAGDLDILLGNWNAGTPPTAVAAVPEPASLAVLGLGALAALRRR